jgi:hypothetical protein
VQSIYSYDTKAYPENNPRRRLIMDKWLLPFLIGIALVLGTIVFTTPASMTPTVPTARLTPPPTPSIEQAVTDCGRVLGFGAETVMTQEHIAVLSLCLHPKLKQLTRPQ